MNKKRKDCFFGLHFDFHATPDETGIGSMTDPKKVGEYLDAVKPDFVQFDTKGHPGYASFMTAYGNAAPGLEVDHLKIIREETKKRGILLFAHYSGAYEAKVTREHPDWATMEKDGKRSQIVNVTDSPYYETIMLPQIQELAHKYGFDGIWVDGDCCFTEFDYSPEVIEKFKKETGYETIDDDRNSPSRVAFTKWQRKRFDEYIERYARDIHATCPGFELTSSYARSDFQPEYIEGLDYLSGDLTWGNSAGALGRVYAATGQTWDLMSWGMPGAWNTPNGGFQPNGDKPTEHICREAAMVIAQGGAYQIVNSLTVQGEIRMTEKNSMARLAGFVRARQPFCQNAKPVRNAAIWLSNEEHVRTSASWLGDKALYGRMERVFYACFNVTNGGRPVDMVGDDFILSDRIDELPAVIIPEIRYIQPEYRDALVRYMERGGKVIACGPESCKTFVDVASDENRVMFVEVGDIMQGVINQRVVSFGDDMTPVAALHLDNLKPDAPTINAAAWKKVGKGALFCIGWNIFSNYGECGSIAERDLVRHVLDLADPKPETYLEKGIKRVELVPTEKDGVRMVNVINKTDITMWHAACDAFAPLVDLTIAMKLDKKPEKLWFEPEHKELEFTYDGEYAHVFISRVDIHGIIVAE